MIILKNTMKLFSEKFLILFDLCDFFRFQPALRLGKKEKTSTSLGKFLSIGIMAFILYMFITSDCIKRENPQVISQTIELKKRPEIFLNEENFKLIVNLANDDNVAFAPDPTVFDILMEYSILEALSGGGYERTVFEIRKFHICNDSDFPSMPNLLTDLGLKNSLCLDNKTFSLQGFWDEPNLKFALISVNRCVNSSESNVVCKSKEEIDRFLNKKYFNYYYEKNTVDVNNYEHPFGSVVKTSYKLIDLDVSKHLFHYIHTIDIETNDGLLFDRKTTVSGISSNRIEYDTEKYSDERGKLINLFFYCNDVFQPISRKYQSLQTLLANIGGITNFLMIIGFILSKTQNILNMKNIVINELYFFPKNIRNSKSDRIKSNFSVNKQANLNKDFKNSQKTNEFEIFCHQNNQKGKLYFSVFDSIKLLFKRRKNLTDKEKLFKKGEEFFAKEINLLEILKKLQEVDKLKAIFLDSDQLFLFNLLSKPMIKIETTKGKFKETNLEKILKSRNSTPIKSKSVITHYKKIATKEGKTEVDKRILEMLDESIREFFNNYQ